MECGRVKHLLPVLHWKTLDSAQATEIRRHLEGCKACRNEESLFSATWQLLGHLPEIEPSPTFRARFWGKVRQGEKAPAGWRDFLGVRWVPMAAGLLATWIVGVAVGVALYGTPADQEASLSVKAVGIFASPYPLNSIETVYLRGGNVERHNHEY